MDGPFNKSPFSGLSPFGRGGGGAVVAPVDLSQGQSLRFPEGNMYRSNAADTLALQTTWTAGADGKNLFYPLSSDGTTAIFVHCRLPAFMRSTNNRYQILSGFSDSGGDYFSLNFRNANDGSAGQRNKAQMLVRSQNILSPVVDEDEFLLVIETSTTSSTQARINWFGSDGTKHTGSLSGTFNPVSIGSAEGFFTLGALGAEGADPVPGTGYPDDAAVGFPGEIKSVGIIKSGTSGTLIPDTVWQSIAQGGDVEVALAGYTQLFLRVFDGTTASLSAPTSDLTNTSVAWPSNDSLQPGGTVGPSSDSGWLHPVRFNDGDTVGVVVGETSRDVTLSGTADTALNGETVYARLVYEDGEVAVNWTSIGAISGGAWSGSVTVPYDIAKGDIGAVQYSTDQSTILAEDRSRWGIGWTIMFLGQSQLNPHFFTEAALGDLVSSDAAGLVSFAANSLDNADIAPRLHRIGGRNASDGLTVFAEQLYALGVRCPVKIICEAENGTSPAQLISTASGARNWSELVARLDLFGNDVSAIIMNWATAWVNDPAEIFEAMVYGTGPYTGDVNNYFNDGTLRAGWTFGLSPACRYNGATHEQERQRQIEYAQSAGFPVGFPISDFAIGTGDDAHQDGNKQGNRRMGMRLACLAAQCMGVTVPEQPYFTTVTGAGTDTLTVSVALPNGGDLYSPEPSALSSFQVDQGGVSGWSASGFTAAVSGNTVTITKDSGTWDAGTLVRYLANGSVRTTGDGAAEDAVVDGMLYETWDGDVLGLGIPVMGSSSGGVWSTVWSVTAS